MLIRSQAMLIDSTPFIDLLRGYPPAKQAFQEILFGQSISVVTKLELAAGSKTKTEIQKIIRLLETLEVAILPITEEVSRTAEELFISFYHSNGLGIQDALIAATAIVNNEELATHNRNHFDFIPNLKLLVPYQN